MEGKEGQRDRGTGSDRMKDIERARENESQRKRFRSIDRASQLVLLINTRLITILDCQSKSKIKVVA